MAALVKKWKKAVDIYASAEEAFAHLTASSDPVLADKWKEDADKAKSNRQHNVKAMDYFQVAEFPGQHSVLRRLCGSVLTSGCSSGSCPDAIGFDPE